MVIIGKNSEMRLCLIHLLLFCFFGIPLKAADLARARTVRSTVRVDAKSGKLVRSVAITPLVVAPRVLQPAAAKAMGGEKDLPLSDLVEQTARKYEVDPLLVHAVIEVESGYNPDAVSPKGAQGLMQLMPATARRFGVRNSFRISENLEGGVRYLRYLQEVFQDDRLALAAYNAGEAAVIKHNWSIPPYPETQSYVYMVGKKLGESRLRQRGQQTARTVETAQLQTPPEEKHRPVESYVDSEGRLYLRTR